MTARRPADAGPASGAGEAAGRTLPGVFTRFARDYAVQHPNQTIMVLQAGCATAWHELDVAALRDGGYDVVVSQVDDDSPQVRAAVASQAGLAGATLGELRSVPMAPRSFDIVQCSMLLDRISHADIVLSRLVAALRPGGLLLVSSADRDTAAGFLDRRLPRMLRGWAWRTAKPGQPGPFAAVYEPIASSRGLRAFLARHGLTVAHREAGDALGATGRPAAMLAARRMVGWLSGGRLSSRYDEVRYVVRKPEDRFARLLP